LQHLSHGLLLGQRSVKHLFYILKHELGLNDDAKTLNIPQDLSRILAFWIDGYYKRERPPSWIACLNPIDYEQQFIDRLN
jgi:hypothetical protein